LFGTKVNQSINPSEIANDIEKNNHKSNYPNMSPKFDSDDEKNGFDIDSDDEIRPKQAESYGV
jgi:hypothetical protein